MSIDYSSTRPIFFYFATKNVAVRRLQSRIKRNFEHFFVKYTLRSGPHEEIQARNMFLIIAQDLPDILE